MSLISAGSISLASTFKRNQRIEKCAEVQKKAEERVEIVRGGEKIGQKQLHEVQTIALKI
jgi:hypothetical protein